MERRNEQRLKEHIQVYNRYKINAFTVHHKVNANFKQRFCFTTVRMTHITKEKLLP